LKRFFTIKKALQEILKRGFNSEKRLQENLKPFLNV